MLLNLCAPYAPKGGKKKDKGETIPERPMKGEALRGEPPRKVYESDDIVPHSGSAFPGAIETIKGVGQSTLVVESTYASVKPKVKHSPVRISPACCMS